MSPYFYPYCKLLLMLQFVVLTAMSWVAYAMPSAPGHAAWLTQLKNAESAGRQEVGTFFRETTLPDGLVVIHAWDASPGFGEEDRAVGHMALQTSRTYLSVWPEQNEGAESGQPRRAGAFEIDHDIPDSHTGHYLVLNLSLLDFAAVNDAVNNLTEKIDCGEMNFSIGSIDITLPLAESQFVTFPISNCCSQQEVKNICEQVSAYVKKSAERRIFNEISNRYLYKGLFFTYPLVGPYSLLLKPSVDVIKYCATGESPLIANYTYPEPAGNSAPNPARIDWRRGDRPNELDCKQAVMSCLQSGLSPSSSYLFSGAPCQITQELLMQASGSYSASYVLFHGLSGNLSAAVEHATQDIAFSFLNERSRFLASRISTSILVGGQPLGADSEKLAKLLADIVKQLAKAGSAQDVTADVPVHPLADTIEISKGRLNLLFAGPDMLPGGALRDLARRAFRSSRGHSASGIYLYSSIERTFGQPVGNVVRMRMRGARARMLGGCDGDYLSLARNIEVAPGAAVTLGNSSACTPLVFYLIPAGGGPDNFALLTIYYRFALSQDPNATTLSLTLELPSFSPAQCWGFSAVQGPNFRQKGQRVEQMQRVFDSTPQTEPKPVWSSVPYSAYWYLEAAREAN